MKAFVFSGGGNHGPLQVGAVRAVLEQGIKPEILVGCSVGALNAAHLAKDLSLGSIETLAQLWRDVSGVDVYPGRQWGAFWNFVVGRDSLYENGNLHAFLQRNGITPVLRFEHLHAARLFVTATALADGRLHVFGENPHDRVLDALMASTALAPMHPPWEVGGERYVDGGTVTPLPIRVALAHGASEIYAFDLLGGHSGRDTRSLRGVPALLRHSVMTTVRLQVQHDLDLARRRRGVTLIYLPLGLERPVAPTDFDREEEMFEAGYAQAQAALASADVGTHVRTAQSARTSWRARVQELLPRHGHAAGTAEQSA